MGAIKTFVKGIFGGAPKPVAQPAYRPPATQEIDASAETEDAKKKRLIALNASGGAQGLGDTSQATVTKRKLLGM